LEGFDVAEEFREEERRERELEDKLAATHSKEERLEHELDKAAEEETKIEEELEDLRHHKHHVFKLIFIINGEDYTIHAKLEEPLRQAVEKALAESDNTGRREASEWEVRNGDGVLLDQGRSPKELGLRDDEKLYLTLKVGAGG
jgi:predicted  nucleic acid-binding Zn-ribbon protein